MNEKCVVVLMRTRGFSAVVARSFVRNLTEAEVEQLAGCIDNKSRIDPAVHEVNRAINERLAAEQKASVEVEIPAIREIELPLGYCLQLRPGWEMSLVRKEGDNQP